MVIIEINLFVLGTMILFTSPQKIEAQLQYFTPLIRVFLSLNYRMRISRCFMVKLNTGETGIPDSPVGLDWCAIELSLWTDGGFY